MRIIFWILLIGVGAYIWYDFFYKPTPTPGTSTGTQTSGLTSVQIAAGQAALAEEQSAAVANTAAASQLGLAAFNSKFSVI